MITRDEHDVIVGGLNRKVADLRVVSDTLERERNFYYLKLRDLEVATFEQHEKNDQTADPEAREAMDLFIIMIQNILYSTEDGFVAPTPRAASKHVHSVAASSSSLFNVRLSVRPITAANPATASNTAINTPLTPSQSPPPADNSTISRAPSISHTWQSSPPLPAVPGTSSPRSHSTNVPPSPSPTGVILRSRPSSPPSASASPASRQHSLVPALADTPDIFNPPLAETPTDNRDASTTPTPINNVSEVAHRTPSASPPPANDNPSRPSSRSSSRSAIAPPPAPPVASTIIGVASPSRRNSPATLGLLAHLPPLPPSGGSSVASLRESSTSNAELAQSVQPQRSGNASPDAGGDDIEAVQVHPSVETDEPSDGDVGQPEQAEAEEQEDEQEREVEGGGRQFLAIARSRAGLGDVSVPNLLLVNQDEQGDADDDAEAEGEEEREKEKEDVEVAGGGVQEKEMEGLPELPVKEEVASDVV
ncbi:hypothetical protein HK101_001101 [Irineochytrium annulatum]|nr:hypothetical protein HK101_001101 [Irineochytrium annulatum]